MTTIQQAIAALEQIVRDHHKQCPDDDGDGLNWLDGYYRAISDLKQLIAPPAPEKVERVVVSGKTLEEEIATIETFGFGLENYKVVNGTHIRK